MSSGSEEITLPGDWRLGETWVEKAKRKFKKNPFIYLGIAATVGAFVQAGIAMRRGQSQKMNYWMRMRVLMQGLTVVAFVGGVYRLRGGDAIWGQSSANAEEQTHIERAEFQARLRRAEVEHRMGEKRSSEEDGAGR